MSRIDRNCPFIVINRVTHVRGAKGVALSDYEKENEEPESHFRHYII